MPEHSKPLPLLGLSLNEFRKIPVACTRWRTDTASSKLNKLKSIVAASVVLVVCVRVLLNLGWSTDLTQADEPAYLLAGQHVLYEGLLPALQWSPGYALWYAVLLRVFPNPITAYFAQQYVVGIVTALLVWFYLRRIGASRVMSVIGAITWSTQAAYVTLRWDTGWPRPYHFAILLVLAGGAILQDKLTVGRCAWAASFLLLAATVRSEYVLSFGVFVPLCVIVVYRRANGIKDGRLSRIRELNPSLLGAMVLLTATGGLIAYASAYPMIIFDSPFLAMDRSWFAFGQKYSVWFLAQTGLALNPFDDWAVVLAGSFPGAQSIAGAAVSNPREFLRFEAQNLHRLAYVLLAVPRAQPYYFEEWGVVLVAFGGLALRARRGFRAAIDLSAVSQRRGTLAYLGAASLAILPSALIAPGLLYSLPFLLTIFVMIVIIIDDVVRTAVSKRFRPVLEGCFGLLVMAWLIFPSPFDTIPMLRPQLEEVNRFHQVLVNMNIENNVTLLDVGGVGYCAYLPYGTCHEIDASWRIDGESLNSFVRRKDIMMILVTPRLLGARLFRNDPDFESLLLHPEVGGWVRIPLMGSDTLLVEKSVERATFATVHEGLP